MTTQQDDFLAQVFDAEEAAAQKKTKATEQARVEVAKYEKELEAKRGDVLAKAKDEAKEKLQVKQASAKEAYQASIKEGEKEAASLKKEAETKEAKIVTSAQGVFVGEIL